MTLYFFNFSIAASLERTEEGREQPTATAEEHLLCSTPQDLPLIMGFAKGHNNSLVRTAATTMLMRCQWYRTRHRRCLVLYH